MKKTISLLLAFVLNLAIGGLAQAATITIGPGANYDFDTIQFGIDAAMDGDMVLVAPGEYVITEPVTFRGKAITLRSEAGPDETTIRMGTPADPNRGSVVVFDSNETAASVLEGFTITGGIGSSVWVPYESRFARAGGGIVFDASSGTVENCVIVQNRVEDSGAGVFCAYSCSPRLFGCIIKENSAGVSGGGVLPWYGASLTMTDCTIVGNSAEFGAGLLCEQDSLVTVTDCIFSGNSATGVGGGVMCYQNSSMTMTHCAIMTNTSQREGGGIASLHGSATVVNCVIAGNMSVLIGYGGGGLACVYPDSSMTISNCTIWRNSATVSSGGGVLCYEGSTMLVNSIVWRNTAARGDEISVANAGTLSVTYSNVGGGQSKVYIAGSTLNWDAGNIEADTLFAKPGYWADVNDPNIVVEPDDPNAMWIDGDYHLKSEAGRWDPISESWIIDDVTSPCIDRGDPNSPVGNEPDPNGNRINMGAYGGTSEASMSIGQLPPLPPPKPLAYWKLDETEGGIAHDSAGVNDGILNGGPLWQPTAGQIDGALAFDGIDDYISTDFVLDPSWGAFSVFAWIKGCAPGQVIISQTDDFGTGETWLGCDMSDGKLMTGLVTNPLGRFKPEPLVSQVVITDNQWHHIGFVWDGSYRYLYLDGTEVAKDTRTLTQALMYSVGGLYIGARKDLDATSYFSGLIDDIRIFNKAFNEEEIAILHQ
jgi:hypothetical protein